LGLFLAFSLDYKGKKYEKSMKKVCVLILSALFIFNVNATEVASKKSVEELMELTEVSKMMDVMYSQITSMFNNLPKQMGISDKEKPLFEKHMDKVATLLKSEMNWEKFKSPMIDIYTKRFTEQEIQGLIKFYRSELGQTTIKKMPLIMQDSMLVSQEILKDFMPKVQALAVEMQEEIKQSRQANSE
jgi:hypothetical protein